ncbi:ABC transporter permease subunit [Lichenicola cladoniae]|uniref:ABC transporter permease subunit n=1 Tax=Lichenicola cladoniae TaxID=1484109 RepID=A0A6M8HLL7_9PROT|nr:ABC transporter permease subunit [Lichenicola cladoniae]QKE89238.1 ABC transporter permease subunit [Lichenicola cladoniae]
MNRAVPFLRVALLTGAASILLLIYLPVLWLALLSVSGEPLSGMPGHFTTGWYRALAENRNWVQPTIRSVEIASCVALLSVLGALAAGRGLPLMRRARQPLVLAFLLPLGIPGTVTGLMLFIGYRFMLGIHMGFWSLVLSHFIWAFPFALISMLVVTNRFDYSLLEAAADLGASPRQRFWQIECPLLMPGLVGAALFGFLLSFTELPRSIFVSGAIQTLPLFNWAEASAHSSQVPLIFCLNTLLTVLSTVASVAMIGLLGQRTR